MSEDTWIAAKLSPNPQYGEAERLQRIYRSAIKDLMQTAVEALHDRANEVAKAWPAQADRDDHLATVIHAAIRHAEELGRGSMIAGTRQTTTEHKLIIALREYAKADDAWVHENLREPTKKEQAARDAYIARRNPDRQAKAAAEKSPRGKRKLHPKHQTTQAEVSASIGHSGNVVPMKRRPKPPRDDGAA